METSLVLTNFGPKSVKKWDHFGYSHILAATFIFKMFGIKLQTRLNWLRSKYNCGRYIVNARMNEPREIVTH